MEPLADQPGVSDLFKLAFRRHSTTVTVITFLDAGGQARGMTATAVCALSMVPPSLIACINRTAKTRSRVVAAAEFGVNILSFGQEQVASHCAKPGSEKLLDPSWILVNPKVRTPILRGALAHFECQIARIEEIYTHSLLIGDVVNVWLGPRGQPLLYSDGAYRTLDSEVEKSYELLWERVMSTSPMTPD